MGGKKVVCSFVILVLAAHLFFIINSASCSRLAQQTDTDHYYYNLGTVKNQQPHKITKKDITNPTTTVPTIIPASSTAAPTVVNPTSVPDTTIISNQPTPTTGILNTPPSLSASWCIASQGASRAAVQVALDYACGYGGADCTAIQPNGACYNPNTVRDHASYAFNQYYQKNPAPTSCNFGGTAVVTSTDPSTGSCQYKSTSTSSSILNITNSSGATVFGAHVPSGPSTSEASRRRTTLPSPITPFFLLLLGLYLNDLWFKESIWKPLHCLF